MPEPTLDFHQWVSQAPDERAAVATVLGALTAEVPWKTAFGDAEVYRHALAPVLRRAYELLDEGAYTPEQSATLERRLRKLTPPLDVLEQISRPVGEAIFEKITAWDDAELCRDVWHEGFPTGTPLAGLDCFLFDSYPEGTDAYQIYFPTTWRDDPGRMRTVRAAAEAAVRSDVFYSRLGTMPRVRIVFTPSYYIESDGSLDLSTYAHVPGRIPSRYCPVTVWQASFETSLDIVRQTVAHELFHCLQSSAIGDLNSGAYDDAQWWVEGGAEYFGNVVYPRVNDERGWDRDFAALISVKPLTTLDYTAYPFFQFLEADLGEPGRVFEFMRGLSRARGQAAQQRALASRYTLDETFHRFGQAVHEGTLLDTDGTAIPFPRLRMQALTPAGSAEIAGPPFSIKLAAVRVPEGNRLAVELSENGRSLESTVSSRSVPGATGDWTSPPAREVDASCEEKAEVFILTSTEPSMGGTLSYQYEPTLEEKECEPGPPPPIAGCGPFPQWMHGTWTPDLNRAFSPGTMDLLFPSQEGQLRFEGYTGSVEMNVTASLIRYRYSNLTLNFLSPGGGLGGGAMRTTMTLNGNSASGGCFGDGTLDLEPSGSSVRMNLVVSFPGSDVDPIEGPMDLSEVFSTAPQGRATVTRIGDELRMIISGPTADGSLRTLFTDARYRKR